MIKLLKVKNMNEIFMNNRLFGFIVEAYKKTETVEEEKNMNAIIKNYCLV